MWRQHGAENYLIGSACTSAVGSCGRSAICNAYVSHLLRGRSAIGSAGVAPIDSGAFQPAGCNCDARLARHPIGSRAATFSAPAFSIPAKEYENITCGVEGCDGRRRALDGFSSRRRDLVATRLSASAFVPARGVAVHKIGQRRSSVSYDETTRCTSAASAVETPDCDSTCRLEFPLLPRPGPSPLPPWLMCDDRRRRRLLRHGLRLERKETADSVHRR